MSLEPPPPRFCQRCVTRPPTGRGGRCGVGGCTCMYLRARSGRENDTETDNGSVVELLIVTDDPSERIPEECSPD